jgi:NADPH-dependent curcumin reductase CurA
VEVNQIGYAATGADDPVAEGIRSAPRAFLGMLKGENLGKQLVKVA